MAKRTWTRHEARILTRVLKVAAVDVYGRPFAATMAQRLDGRGGKGWRVDMRTLGPWEATDGGVPLPSERAARAYADAWVAAATEQQTLTPRAVAR